MNTQSHADLSASLAAGPLTQFGPARVRAVEPGRALVEGEGFKAWATLALAYGYRPAVDDVLLVAGGAQAFYVIGVLQGRGDVVLTSPGDLQLHAPRGRVTVKGGAGGVAVEGDTVEITARTLRVRARETIERFGSVCRRVAETFRLRAKRSHVTVEEEHRLRAGSIHERASGDVKIDGDQIRLG